MTSSARKEVDRTRSLDVLRDQAGRKEGGVNRFVERVENFMKLEASHVQIMTSLFT